MGDVIFLPDLYVAGSLPSLSAPYLRAGHRLVIPNFSSIPRDENGEVAIEVMVHAVGDVLKDLTRRDNEASQTADQPSNTSTAGRRRATVNSVEELKEVEKEKEEASEQQQPRRFSVASTVNSSTWRPHSRSQKPVFLVGLGLGGLVALHYGTFASPFTSTAKTRRTSWVESVIEPVQTLISDAVSTVNKRNSTLSHRIQASVALAPFPVVSGIILLSPTVDPNLTLGEG